MTGSSGPCPASFAPNGQLGSGSSISTVSTSGMSSEVRLLYSRSDGILCTSALESLGGSLRKTCSSISASERPMYTLPKIPSLLRSEEHTTELQSRQHIACRLLL